MRPAYTDGSLNFNNHFHVGKFHWILLYFINIEVNEFKLMTENWCSVLDSDLNDNFIAAVNYVSSVDKDG